MSLTPLLPTTNARHNRAWTINEDRVLSWGWKSGASDEELTEQFGRTLDAISVRASKLGLGRRGKAQVVKIPDESLKSKNENLKAENSRITGLLRELGQVFEGAANHIKTHLQ